MIFFLPGFLISFDKFIDKKTPGSYVVDPSGDDLCISVRFSRSQKSNLYRSVSGDTRFLAVTVRGFALAKWVVPEASQSAVSDQVGRARRETFWVFSREYFFLVRISWVNCEKAGFREAKHPLSRNPAMKFSPEIEDSLGKNSEKHVRDYCEIKFLVPRHDQKNIIILTNSQVRMIVFCGDSQYQK